MRERLDRDQFARWLAVEQGNVESYEGLGTVPTEYVRFLGGKYAWLNKNDHDREAFEVIVLILRVVEYIPDPAERTRQAYWACRGMAATCSFLGLWRASMEGYNRAISIGGEGAYALIEASYRGPGGPGSAAQYQPADHRELGSMHRRIGSYGDAVVHHRTAGKRLEGVRSRLDDHTYRDELARLRNARGLSTWTSASTTFILGKLTLNSATRSARERASRISGKIRKSPLMRVEHEGVYAAVASLGGAPKNPLWYNNVVADSRVEVQDGPDRQDIIACEVSGEERAVWWKRAVAAFPKYAEYQENMKRVIPVFVLESAPADH